MVDKPSYSHDLPIPEEAHAFLSPDFERFQNALEELYIPGNMSGRHRFYDAWPRVAAYVFGAELIGLDQDGAPDRERRIKLEDEAEVRRLAVLDQLYVLENESVFEGALKTEYVENVLNKYGRVVGLKMYARALVDRFLPPADGEVDIEEGVASKQALREHEEAQLVDSIAPALDHMPGDVMDNIKPIDAQTNLDDGDGLSVSAAVPKGGYGLSTADAPNHSQRTAPDINVQAPVVSAGVEDSNLPPLPSAGQSSLPPMPGAQDADVNIAAPQNQGLPPMPSAAPPVAPKGVDKEVASAAKAIKIETQKVTFSHADAAIGKADD